MKRTTGQDRTITRNWRPATQAVRGGTARSEFGETSEALFLTSGYCYDKAGDAAARFAGEQQGMTYSRLQNPTVEMLEERIALLEGAEACRTMASGMAAMTAALLCQLQQGDHVVAGRALILPGASYDYVSGCPLTTSTGSMQGSYHMLDTEGAAFDVAIPKFALTAPAVGA